MKKELREILSELAEISHNTKEGFNASPIINKKVSDIKAHFYNILPKNTPYDPCIKCINKIHKKIEELTSPKE